MIRILLGRSRVSGFCVGACLLLAVSQSWGLGLGEIEIDSALNEKLSAKIELLDASGLQPAEILVSLASNEDFKRVGVERLFLLTDLSFEVTYGTSGGATVAVTSSRPITEPYLNFLVQVLWPNGRLLKEFTLLLDPPTFSPAAAPAVSAPRRSEAPGQSAGRVARPAPSRPATQVQISPKPQESAPRSRLQSELMTGRSDTLWVIASNTLPSSAVTVQQKMLAIQRLNGKAFINNNINLLKAGYLLRLPSESEVRSLSEREAVAMVATQHDEWRAYRRGETPSSRDTSPAQVASASADELQGQVDATGARGAGGAEVASSSGELRIVAGSGASASGTAQASEGDLDAALEETDRLGREVDELTYQLDREQELASNQLGIKDRQLAVKDQQIAELQAQMAQIQQQLNEQPQNQNQNTLAPTSGGPWWQSPYVLGGVAGVLVLALVGGLIVARRNREVSDAFDPVGKVALEERSKPALAQVEQQPDEELSEFEEEADQVVDVSVADEADEDSPADQNSLEEDLDDEDLDDEEVGVSQTGDVIGEADIYIAYGRYPQAIGLLLGVLEDDADRNDVRLKLLELFVETDDREAFESHMAELVDRCDDDDALLTAREFESRLGENDLEGLSNEATADSGEVESELDELANVDDFDLDLDADIDDGASSSSLEELEELDQDDSLVEFNVDSDQPVAGETDVEALDTDDPNIEESFELELDEVEGLVELAEEDDLGSGDELGGDLGIDFDPDRNLTAESDDTVAGPVSGSDTVSTTADTLLTNKVQDTEFETDVATVEEDEFEFDDEGDSANTKLDLARAYIDMGDQDGARDILKEVLEEGNSDQQQQAQSILEGL